MWHCGFIYLIPLAIYLCKCLVFLQHFSDAFMPSDLIIWPTKCLFLRPVWDVCFQSLVSKGKSGSLGSQGMISFVKNYPAENWNRLSTSLPLLYLEGQTSPHRIKLFKRSSYKCKQEVLERDIGKSGRWWFHLNKLLHTILVKAPVLPFPLVCSYW